HPRHVRWSFGIREGGGDAAAEDAGIELERLPALALEAQAGDDLHAAPRARLRERRSTPACVSGMSAPRACHEPGFVASCRGTDAAGGCPYPETGSRSGRGGHESRIREGAG